MNLSNVKIIGGPLVLATDAQVDELEASLDVAFPKGYREYVTTLGEGVLGGTFVRVYPPWRIAKELQEWRERIAMYWFWDQGKSILTQERALESIIITDTLNGDELVFHPEEPAQLVVLPRHSEDIFEAGLNLLDAVEWMCSSGKLTKRFKARNFEPFDSRKA